MTCNRVRYWPPKQKYLHQPAKKKRKGPPSPVGIPKTFKARTEDEKHEDMKLIHKLPIQLNNQQIKSANQMVRKCQKNVIFKTISKLQ